MLSKRFAYLIVAFNAIMGFVMFLSSQLILLTLTEMVVKRVDYLIYYDFSFRPPTIVIYPLPNYPLIIFIIMLVVNVYFLSKVRSNREVSAQNSKI